MIQPARETYYDLDLLKFGFEGERGITAELYKKYGTAYAPKAIVIQEGDPGSEVYLIISGRVVVCEKLAKGSFKVLASLGPGEMFGEMAALEGQARSATLISATAVKLLKLSGDDFQFILKTHPRWAFKLLGSLSKRILNAFDQVTELHKQRLAGGDPTA